MSTTVEDHTFQETLAQEAGSSEGTGTIQLLSFRLGKEEYGMEITKIREIILMGEITRIPQTPEYVKGLINLRSTVIPVIDLRIRFGLPEAEPPTKCSRWEQRRARRRTTLPPRRGPTYPGPFPGGKTLRWATRRPVPTRQRPPAPQFVVGWPVWRRGIRGSLADSPPGVQAPMPVGAESPGPDSAAWHSDRLPG